MLRYFSQKNAQIVSEYAMTFFIAFSVIIAMGVFIKRSLQARVYDARNTMVSTVESRWGQTVPPEYEPYTMNSSSDVTLSVNQTKSHNGSLFQKDSTQSTKTENVSIQVPAKDAK